MNEGLIPSRYAKALYKYAQEHHVAAPIYEEMKRLDAAFATHTELSKALSNRLSLLRIRCGYCHRLSVKSPTIIFSVLFS